SGGLTGGGSFVSNRRLSIRVLSGNLTRGIAAQGSYGWRHSQPCPPPETSWISGATVVPWVTQVPTPAGAGFAKDGDCTADPGKARKRKGRRSRPFARPPRSAKPEKVQGRSGRGCACASPIARPKDNRRAPG